MRAHEKGDEKSTDQIPRRPAENPLNVGRPMFQIEFGENPRWVFPSLRQSRSEPPHLLAGHAVRVR
jgi:hypothetical protein